MLKTIQSHKNRTTMDALTRLSRGVGYRAEGERGHSDRIQRELPNLQNSRSLHDACSAACSIQVEGGAGGQGFQCRVSSKLTAETTWSGLPASPHDRQEAVTSLCPARQNPLSGRRAASPTRGRNPRKANPAKVGKRSHFSLFLEGGGVVLRL